MKNQDYLYLDHAASTPMRTSALEKYVEAESFGFANSSGGHKLSRDSKNLLEDSREKIAGLFNAAPGEIIFTSGGTEADNWTIKSLFESKKPRYFLFEINSLNIMILEHRNGFNSFWFSRKHVSRLKLD